MSSQNDGEDVDSQDGQCFGSLPSMKDRESTTMEQEYEHVDAKSVGKVTKDKCASRPSASVSVTKDSREYKMDHARRGKCIVFYYSKFDSSMKGLGPRGCAEADTEKVQKAFEFLGFEVEAHENLTKTDLEQTIRKESKQDHSDCDCLAVVFMSHGTFDTASNCQQLWAYDDWIEPQVLWKSFEGTRCPKLAGKPKMFFIQACRGERTDIGLTAVNPRRALCVQMDSSRTRSSEEGYTLPSQADMLIMWASYPGHFAFKSNNNGIKGSVFIHFLCKELTEAEQRPLLSILTGVSRGVALDYESYNPMKPKLDFNKQIPVLESTLIRDVYFLPKKANGS